MTDEEKIEWFDKTIEWLEQFGTTADEIYEQTDHCNDAPNDLFVDMVNQFTKVKGQ